MGFLQFFFLLVDCFNESNRYAIHFSSCCCCISLSLLQFLLRSSKQFTCQILTVSYCKRDKRFFAFDAIVKFHMIFYLSSILYEMRCIQTYRKHHRQIDCTEANVLHEDSSYIYSRTKNALTTNNFHLVAPKKNAFFVKTM